MLEKVDAGLQDLVRAERCARPGRLMHLPTLVRPKIGDSYRAQIAQVGSIVSLTQSGRDYRFRFIRNPRIPTSRIEAAASQLHIGEWDFTRTRWSVKSGTCTRALLEQSLRTLMSR